MPNNLYIATIEPRSGKSVVALGIMALLSRRIHNVGYFRPIIPDVERDNDLQLILSRYNLKLPYEDMYAYYNDDAESTVTPWGSHHSERNRKSPEEARKRILERSISFRWDASKASVACSVSPLW